MDHAATRAPRRTGAALPVPTFALYGEAPAGQELLHIEPIASRSSARQWEIDAHVHQGLLQVLWVGAGSVRVLLDAAAVEEAGPVAVLVPPGVVHGFRFAPQTDGLVLTASPRFLLGDADAACAQAFHALFSAPGVVRLADPLQAARCDTLLRALAAEFGAPGGSEGPALAWLARAAVWRLAQARAQAPAAGDRRAWRDQALYARFLVLLEAHLLEHWRLAQYASRLGLSTARLNRLARAQAGCSAQEVVHERLTREACRRLAWLPAPVASLAPDLGFDDPAYFSRFFKRRTGLTPQRWRELHRQQAH